MEFVAITSILVAVPGDPPFVLPKVKVAVLVSVALLVTMIWATPWVLLNEPPFMVLVAPKRAVPLVTVRALLAVLA